MEDFTGTRPRGEMWGAHISNEGRQISLGNWPSEKEAALAYDCAALYLRGDGHARNFPNEATPKSPRQLKREAAHTRNEARGADSKYIGVISLKRNGATVWKAQAKIGESQTSLGEYACEKDAACAYDAAVRFYFDEPVTNFDGDEALPLEEIRRRCKTLKHEKGWPGLKPHTSRYRGVYLEGESGLWYAQITAEKQHIYLGRYRREADAACAYDEAAREHFGENAWTNADMEPFEKPN